MTPTTRFEIIANDLGEEAVLTNRTGFTLDSPEKVEWYLKKLATLESEKERVKRQAARRLKEIEEDVESLRFQFQAQAEAWAKQELERRGSTRKTLTLLQGSIAFRRLPKRLVVTDRAAALEAATRFTATLSHCVKVKTSVELDANAYKEAGWQTLETTGELLPGLEVKPEEEACYLSFGKEASE